MTVQQSKSIGGKLVLKLAAYLFCLYEIAMLFKNTRGDFANGLLFFISNQMNGYILMFFILYFISMYLAGRHAGYSILIKKRKYYGVAIFNGFLTTSLTLLYFYSAIFLITYNEPQVLERHEIIETLLKSFVVLLVTLIIAWLWVAKKIKMAEV